MHNRITNLFDESAPRKSGTDRPWHVDQNPGLRLAWMFVLLALPVAIIGARLAYLQIFLTDVYVDSFDVTSIEEEPIPARDGRILSADGRLLADDLERFNISVHYRWLEEPPNETWLKQQAMVRLARKDRRDPERIEAAKKEVLARRDALWRGLATWARLTPDQLSKQRSAVQQRVERIVEGMRKRREERLASPPEDIISRQAGSESTRWSRAWRAVVTALTTPPRRDADDPLIAREELDYHTVIENVTLAVRAEIESHPQRYPGVKIETSAQRIYPESSVAPHIIGKRLPLTAEEFAERKEQFDGRDPLDYQPGDRIGRTGIERSYDAQLHGLRGLKRIVRNRHGEIIASEVLRAPRPGQDIEVTLQMGLQQEMEALLDQVLAGNANKSQHENDEENPDSPEPPALIPDGASIVAIDIRTGEVIAAVSAPRFDLGHFARPDEESWRQINNDPRRPLFHRAIQMTLPPGSVFKTLTSVAVIESRVIDPDARVVCQGYLDPDHPNRHRCYIYSHYGIGHGDTTLSDALCRSCNVYFYEAAHTIGPEPIVAWADRFGFGHPTGVDLPGETGGHVPSPDSRRTVAGGGTKKSPWYPGDTLGLAIGQSRLTVTPIQVARMMAAVANGGYLVTPHVARLSVSSNRSSVEQAVMLNDTARRPSQELRKIAGLSDITLERIREGLERVVSDPSGTGYKTVRMEAISIAGKTGTAEVGGGKPDHAWFAGYVPVDKPQIAFAVVLEHAGSGGKAAGPVARKFVEALLEQGLLQPTRLVAHEQPANRTINDE